MIMRVIDTDDFVIEGDDGRLAAERRFSTSPSRFETLASRILVVPVFSQLYHRVAVP